MTGQKRTALVVAHPGHEVRLHGWLEAERPQLFILTDGSGRTGRAKIGETTRYAARLGVAPGRVFGRFTDAEVYRSVLTRDFDLFTGLCDEMAGAFAECGVERVVCDAAEGYNTTHDICRLVASAAADVAALANGLPVSVYDFPVVGRPEHCPAHLRPRALRLELDDGAFARKLAAAREFYPELLAEVEEAVRGAGGGGPLKDFLEREGGVAPRDLEMFRVECLRPADDGAHAGRGGAKPFYEIHGERQVAAGHYERVISYREHVAPLADALRAHAGRSLP